MKLTKQLNMFSNLLPYDEIMAIANYWFSSIDKKN